MIEAIFATPVDNGWVGMPSPEWGGPTRQGRLIYEAVLANGIQEQLDRIIKNSSDKKADVNFVYYYFLTEEEMYVYAVDEGYSVMLGYVGWDEPVEVIIGQLRAIERKGSYYERTNS